MSKFLPPNTTTAIRIANTPLKGELLFDTDLNKLFIGDGVTVGGIEVGSGEGGGSGGDMYKAIYDTDNDGIVDLATAIAGSPSVRQYYGTGLNNTTKGFYDLYGSIGLIEYALLPLVNGSFESPQISTNTFANSVQIGWNESILINNGSTAYGNAIPVYGTQCWNVQLTLTGQSKEISQTLSINGNLLGVEAVVYAAKRPSYPALQKIECFIDTTLIYSFVPVGTNWVKYSSGMVNISSLNLEPNTPFLFKVKVTQMGNSDESTFIDKVDLLGLVSVPTLIEGGSGDMTKAIYDTDNDGIVDEAEVAAVADLAINIAGNPTANQYYGTNAAGTKGFYTLPEGGSGGAVPRNQIQAIVLAGLTI